MSEAVDPYKRIIGIDPCSRGFGYVVIEANGRLLDWGLTGSGSRGPSDLLHVLERIALKYGEIRLAVEKCRPGQRSKYVNRLIQRIVSYAALSSIECVLCSRHDVRRCLGLDESATKHQIAVRLCELFPDLLQILPHQRRLWDGEHLSMNVFDAAGLAVAAMPWFPASEI